MKKSKSKIQYHEDVYPAEMETEGALYYLSSQWVTNMQEFKDACMPVVIFRWDGIGGQCVAMHHQSLQ